MKYKTKKKIILTLRTLNTINLLVNPFTHIQMMKLLSQAQWNGVW